MAHDVFISHSSKDKVMADAICAGLEARGIRCWIAPRDINSGQNYAGQICDAIESSKVFILVLSDNANLSTHILKEVELAVQSGNAILPFRIQDVHLSKDLKYYLSNVHWLDAITPPMEKHIGELADFIQKITNVPGATKYQGVLSSGFDDERNESPPQIAKPRQLTIKRSSRVPLIILICLTAASMAAGGFWLRSHPEVLQRVEIATSTPSPSRVAFTTPERGTPTPKLTTTPTFTPTPYTLTGVSEGEINCRDSIGIEAKIIKIISRLEEFNIVGRNQTNEWVNVEFGTGDDSVIDCWIYNRSFDTAGDTSLLPVLTPSSNQ